jgi:hypothetical protein
VKRKEGGERERERGREGMTDTERGGEGRSEIFGSYRENTCRREKKIVDPETIKFR